MQRQLVIDRSSFDVLQALTSSQHTSHWWQCQTRFDPEHELLSWQWRNEQGDFEFIVHARVADYEPGLYLRLANIWHYDKKRSVQPVGPFEMLFECTPQAGQTLLMMEITAATASMPYLQPHMEEIVNGWDEMIPKLRAYLERPPAII